MTNAVLSGKPYVAPSQYYGGPERFDKLEISSGNPRLKYLVCTKMIMLLLAAMPALGALYVQSPTTIDGITYEVHEYPTVYDFGEHNYAYPVSAVVTSGVGPVARIAAYLGVSEITASSIPVVRIEPYAFSGCEALTSVTIPSTVVMIGYSAFKGCSELMSFSVAADNPVYKSVSGLLLTKDGKRLLAVAGGLTGSVAVPNGVTEIEQYAFKGCRRLTSVTIPNSVPRLWLSDFESCSGLMSFSVAANNPSYKSVSGLLLSKDGKRILAVPRGLTSSVAVPNGVTEITDRAFKGCSVLTGVTIPNSVTNIGEGAFYNCRSLTSVTIPDSVTRIGIDAFYGCRGLMSFSVATNNPSYKSDSGLLLTKDGTRIIAIPWGLTSVVFPNSVTEINKEPFSGWNGSVTVGNGITRIESGAFWYCSGLTSVTIPDSVTSIEGYAFRGCSGLTSVNIPDGVTRIGDEAFMGCTNMTSVHITDLAKWCGISFVGYDSNPLYYAHNLYLNGEKVTDLVIPDGVKIIGRYAFEDCSGLTSVTIPDSVTSIGSFAFVGCTNLTSVTIGNGVTSIGEGAFYNCSGLTSVTIPDSVTSIGGRAFFGCSGLTSVTIPDSVTRIGYGAFAWCRALTSVTIPNSVTSIGEGAFSGCSGLKSVTIPNSVTSIGTSAFKGCSGLKSVTIPNSVTSIVEGAFSGCSGLEEITLPFVGACRGNSGAPESLFGYIFGSSSYTGGTKTQQQCSSNSSYSYYIPSKLRKVVVTRETVLGYGAFSGCSSLASVTIPASVTSMDKTAFSDCPALIDITLSQCFSFNYKVSSDSLYNQVRSVTIADGVTSIPTGAFWGWSMLMNVTIPDSVTNIEDYAFSGCSGLMSVTIPNSVTKIMWGAFSDCSGLTSVAIPDSVTSIGYGAFRNCSGLTSVTIPNSVTSIGDYAFSGCSGLTSVYVSIGDADRIKGLMRRSPGIDVDRVSFVEVPRVVFVTNAEEVNVRSRYVMFGDAVGELPVLLRTGYVFAGWWTATSGGTQISDATVVTGDMTLYAHWKTIDPFPEICEGVGVSEALTGMADVRLGKNIKTAEQYNAFRRWTESNDIAYKTAKGSSRTWFSYAVGADGLVEKVFEKDDVTIDLPAVAYNGALSIEVNVDGLSLGASATAQNLATVFDVQGASSLADDSFSSENVDVALGVSSDGKLLVRATPKAANGTFFIRVRMHPEDGGEQVGGDPVSAIVTVTFDANGGKGGTSRSVVVGEPVGALPIVSRDNYAFDNWWTATDGGAQVGASTIVTGDVTYYAHWIADTYAIVYKPGANGSGTQQTATKTYDVPLSLGGALFARDGYTQTGWATSDGGAKVYDLGASYTANAALTLYPFWTANKYTLTFDANGGTGGKTVTLDYGTALSAPTVTRDGHTFTGWSPSVPATVPAGDMTYTAQWTVNKYTVTFDANGGTGGKAVTLNYGAVLSAPTVTRDGWTFSGWSPSVPATVPAGDVTCMAQWTANTYTVTYDPGANGSGAQQTDTKTSGIALKLRGCMFTREGYTQTGWTKWEGVYGSYKDYDLGASYTANAAVTLYPYWTANTYTVTYKPGANGSGSQQTVTKKHDVGLVLKDALFTRDGYTQTGWAVSDGGSLVYSLGVTYTKNAAITFYPYWTANTYTVTYKPGANGSGSQQTDKKTGGVALTLRDGIFTRDGYTQTGWATSDGGDKVYDIGAAYTVNAEVTLYPYWTVGTYTVTYAPGVYGSGTQQTDTKTDGVALTLRGSIFTRYCYTQTGWATVDRGAKAYDLGASYTANEAVTLYPYWTANTYMVTYQPGASGSGSLQTAIKTADKTLTLKGAIFTRSGYTQAGWSKSDGGVKAYDLGASYTANAAVTLYPFWTVNTYTVTYKPGANGSGSQQTATKTHDVTLSLKGATFTRDGCTQTGWATSDGGAKAYNLYSPYTNNAEIVLYPYWAANSPVIAHEKVQLWEGGPYWATTNIGAENPEDYGYYFWWGDTIGCSLEEDKWMPADGSFLEFSFVLSNAPTYNKDINTLKSEGWIADDSELAPEHDAAHVHWGGAWRMPTKQELDDLVSKCDWTWSLQNGVQGYIVKGKGAYAPVSIFLPCAGSGYGTSLEYAGSYGDYWSSSPSSISHNAWFLDIGSDYQEVSDSNASIAWRMRGRSVRPVQNANEAANTYTITFDANGGVCDVVKTLECGATLVAPTVTREGYVFIGWTPAVPPTTPAANATYTAQWAKLELNEPIWNIDSNGVLVGVDMNGCAEAVIPSTVRSIGDDAFSGCSVLSKVTIPNSVTNIGGGAFSECTALSSVTLPDSVTSIGYCAFEGCSALTNVRIPSSITCIEYNTFYDCSRIASLVIPDSVTSFDWSAIEGCSSLKSVSIGKGVTSIGDYAFVSSSLTNITIGSSVASIGESAFYGLEGLTSVIIPDSVTSIGDSAFNGCSGLKHVTIGSGVTRLERNVFFGCGLTSVTIPDSVTSIGEGAFVGCRFTSVSIPASVTSIGGSAFYYCDDLAIVTMKGDCPVVGSDAFYGVGPSCVVYLPRGNSTYQVSSGRWQGMMVEYYDPL